MPATSAKHGGGTVVETVTANRANRKADLVMKRIEAVVRRDKLSEVKRAMATIPHRGLTACDIQEQDAQGGTVLLYRGTRCIEDMVPRVSVSVLIDEADATAAVGAIANAARTGRDGDGTIVVVPIETVVHISGSAEVA